MSWNDERDFMEAWASVRIARGVSYSLFTFGQSDLPYYLVCSPGEPGKLVTVRRGDVKVDRPRIITPYNAQPEFRDFFEQEDESNIVQFLLSRSAAFSNLKLTNHSGPEKIVSDSVEEAVAKLNRQLDDEEDDRVAIITAPAALAGVAVLRYASERIWSSAPDNVQELRERGFLP